MPRTKLSLLLFLAIIWFAVKTEASPTQSIQSQLAGKIDIVVATDNSGDYNKVQDAINAVPDNTAVRKVIFIKKGKYVEKVVVPYKKTNIVLVGENVDSCIISYNDASLGGGTFSQNTFTSYTFRVDADDFVAMNVTIENTNNGGSQAVSLHANGDRQVFLHCRIRGYIDTFFNNIRTRGYLKDCFIQGSSDFIFGFGIDLFDSCVVNTISTNANMTAAGTSQNYKFGYVFSNCKLTSPANVTSFSLGRPWFSCARTVILTSWEGNVLPAGWNAWAGRESTCYYREYKCTGPGYKPASRVSWANQLTDQEAANYAMDTIFSKNSFPQGPTADTGEINAILTRWLVSTTDSMEQIALILLKCGRDSYPSIPTDDWMPQVDTNDIYAVIKNNTVKFMDSGKVELAANYAEPDLGQQNGVHINCRAPGRLIIDGIRLNTGKATLCVYDPRGKSVLIEKVSPLSNGQNVVFCGATGLKHGIYCYTIKINRAYLHGKFEKM